MILAAGAPPEVWCTDHTSSPLGWAVHGSRESGGACSRQEVYTAIVTTFLGTGAWLHYADDDTDAYYTRLLRQASRSVRVLLWEAWKTLEVAQVNIQCGLPFRIPCLSYTMLHAHLVQSMLATQSYTSCAWNPAQ